MGERIAIVAGVRTPFIKAGTRFAELSAVELGRLAVKEVLARGGIDPGWLGSVIIGNVAQPLEAVNIARVIALSAGIPEAVPAFTVHRNCASGLQAVISGAQAIATGEAELVLAGGVESMSNIPFFFGKRFRELAGHYLQSRNTGEKLATLLKLRPADFAPTIGLLQGLTDPTCGLSMGQTAEVLARELAISREAQDQFALLSHQRTTAAQAAGRFKDEIMTVLLPPDYREVVDADNGVRADESLELLARLQPAFDREFGTVTAGNSSQITDGAAALLLAGEKAVARYGLPVLGYVKEHAFAGLAPQRMGLGPAHATSRLLARTGHELADFGLIEMNEAFAAQMVANEMVFGDEQLSRRYLNSPAIGKLDRALLNVNGGAIAMGHPVGASGARLVLTLLLEMRRRKVDLGLATLCIGGGQGAAMIIERGRA